MQGTSLNNSRGKNCVIPNVFDRALPSKPVFRCQGMEGHAKITCIYPLSLQISTLEKMIARYSLARLAFFWLTLGMARKGSAVVH